MVSRSIWATSLEPEMPRFLSSPTMLEAWRVRAMDEAGMAVDGAADGAAVFDRPTLARSETDRLAAGAATLEVRRDRLVRRDAIDGSWFGGMCAWVG